MGRNAFYPDTSDFLEKSIKHNGNISAIASEYGVTRQTIYEYFKRNPDGKEVKDRTLGFNNELDLDMAESVNRFNMMNYQKKPHLAQRAAENVLKMKGQQRGWGMPPEQGVPNQNDITDKHEYMRAKYTNELLQKEIDELKAKINELQSKTDQEFQRSY